MDKVTKEDLQIRYEVFQRYALEDQATYYRREIQRHNRAAKEINFSRATVSLIIGTSAAVAAVIGQTFLAKDMACFNNRELPLAELNLPEWCGTVNFSIIVLIIISIALPALGAFFSSLADLYQWERLRTIYDKAIRNLSYADALSPDDDEDFTGYFTSFHAYVGGALQVMSDETKQWGQSIREPEKTQEFVDEMRLLAEKVSGDIDNMGTDVDDSP